MEVDVVSWILLFLAASLFWGWIIFLGGAQRLEGSILSGFLIHFRAVEWSEEGIKAFALILWIGNFLWFLLGLRSPEIRLFGLL